MCASLDITETAQCALNAILVATSAITLETLTVLPVLTKEVHQKNVVHQESTTTALFVKLVQPMSTLMEVAVKTAMIAVMDAQEQEALIANLVTPETTSKTMVQETVCASLGTTETGQCALNAT